MNQDAETPESSPLWLWMVYGHCLRGAVNRLESVRQREGLTEVVSPSRLGGLDKAIGPPRMRECQGARRLTRRREKDRMATASSKQLPWVFAERLPAAVQTDPFEEEFFIGSSDSELDDGDVASLVRESVQNALDARVGKQPVSVSFAIHEDRAGDIGALDYLAGLKPHLAAISPPVPWPAPHDHSRIRWLAYEHFNTRGLGGDPRTYADDQLKAGGREDFYWFWRNIGRTAKSDERLGRWRLGKPHFILQAAEAQKPPEPPRLAAMVIEPGNATLSPGTTVSFKVVAKDQYGQSITVPAVSWTASGGEITPERVFTAGGEARNHEVTAMAAAVGAGGAGAALATVTIRIQKADGGQEGDGKNREIAPGKERIEWSGENPSQKWMTLYQVPAKFSLGCDLKNRVSFEATLDHAVAKAKRDETNVQLGELGLANEFGPLPVCPGQAGGHQCLSGSHSC